MAFHSSSSQSNDLPEASVNPFLDTQGLPEGVIRLEEDVSRKYIANCATPASPLVYQPFGFNSGSGEVLFNSDNALVLSLASTLEGNTSNEQALAEYREVMERYDALYAQLSEQEAPGLTEKALLRLEKIRLYAAINLIEHSSGMPIKNVLEMASISASNDMMISVREVNSASLPLFYRGAVGKDISTKPKSSNIKGSVDVNGISVPVMKGQIPYNQYISKIGSDRDFEKAGLFQHKANEAVAKGVQSLTNLAEQVAGPGIEVTPAQSIQIKKNLELNGYDEVVVFQNIANNAEHLRFGNDIISAYRKNGDSRYYAFPSPPERREPEEITPEMMNGYEPRPIEVIVYVTNLKMKDGVDAEEAQQALRDLPALDTGHMSDAEYQQYSAQALTVLNQYFHIGTASGVVADEDIFTYGSKNQEVLDREGLHNNPEATYNAALRPGVRDDASGMTPEQERFLETYVSETDYNLGVLSELSAVMTTSMKAATRDNQGVQHGAEAFRTMDCEPLCTTTFFYTDAKVDEMDPQAPEKILEHVHMAVVPKEHLLEKFNELQRLGYVMPIPRMIGWQKNITTGDFEEIPRNIHVDSEKSILAEHALHDLAAANPSLAEAIGAVKIARSEYYKFLLQTPTDLNREELAQLRQRSFEVLERAERVLMTDLSERGVAEDVINGIVSARTIAAYREAVTEVRGSIFARVGSLVQGVFSAAIPRIRRHPQIHPSDESGATAAMEPELRLMAQPTNHSQPQVEPGEAVSPGVGVNATLSLSDGSARQNRREARGSSPRSRGGPNDL
ncbi:MAG: hypothetical protein FJ161_02850 [Gammaproteobacteria bacterium]|nr:hypothetical protein [Gammaproteobacteria bacterium]